LPPSVPIYRYTVKGLDLTETVVELRKSFRDVADTYLADRVATGKEVTFGLRRSVQRKRHNCSACSNLHVAQFAIESE